MVTTIRPGEEMEVGTNGELLVHEAAESFPALNKQQFAGLKENIATHGLLVPIVLCEGKVLDGRNRYRACCELGIEPRFETFEGNPWDHVWSLNGERRDMTDKQKAVIWVKLQENSDRWRRERDEQGRFLPVPTKLGLDCKSKNVTSEVQAAEANVGRGSIEWAKTLWNKRPDLAEKVAAGDMKPAHADREAKRDEAMANATLLPEGKYLVIYADPPWSYRDTRTGDSVEKYDSVEKHYPTMSLADICALDVKSLAADDAVLFLWTTAPLLREGLDVMQKWGFEYKTNFIWYKQRHNMGHYSSVRHEHLLVGTRGSCVPQVGKLFDSVQTIERGEHSEKPEEFRNIIDTIYPVGPRIELFARKKVTGWTSWGNEL